MMNPLDRVEELLREYPQQLSLGKLPAATNVIRRLRDLLLNQPPDARSLLASSIPSNLRVYLLSYARSAATAALSTKDPDIVTLGLEALALEGARFDYRDTWIAMAIVFHSAKELGMDERQLSFHAASLSTTKQFSDMVLKWPDLEASKKELSHFGVRVRKTADGPKYSQDLTDPPRWSTWLRTLRVSLRKLRNQHGLGFRA